jgi:hypothetical protein
MPRGPNRPWKQILPHTKRAIPYIKAALEAGFDVELKITEVSNDEVDDLKRGLFNAAKLQKPRVAVHVHKEQDQDGTWTLTYAVHSKQVARKYVLEHYGTDRTKWAYNMQEKSPRDEYGNRTDN